MANSGWSNDIPNPLIVGGNGSAGQIILLNASGSQSGSLDGNNGLEFVGNDSVASPAFQLTPFADVIWSDPSWTSAATLEIGGIFDANAVFHNGMLLTSNAVSGRSSNELAVFSQDSTGTTPGGLCSGYPLVGNNPTTGSPTNPIAEVWHTLSLQNGWTSGSGSGFATPSYRLNGLGAVEFKGLGLAGIKTNGTTIATLPTGYRPTSTRQMLCSADSNIAPFIVILQCTTAGALQIFALGTGDAIGLDGISFYLT